MSIRVVLHFPLFFVYSCRLGSKLVISGHSLSSFYHQSLTMTKHPTSGLACAPRWWSSQDPRGSHIHNFSALHAMVAEQPFLPKPIASFPTPPQGLVPLKLARSIQTPPACLCRVQLFAPIEEGERCHVCYRSASYMILEHLVFWCPSHADVLRVLHPCTKHIKFLGSFPKMSKHDSEHAYHHAVNPSWVPW